MHVPMTLTTDQWATAVRPLLDHGIIEVPGYRVDGAGDIVREVYNSFGYVIGHCEIEADGRLAFLAVIEGKLYENGWDCVGVQQQQWSWHKPLCRHIVLDADRKAAADRETAALRAAYAQWPELGELKP